MYHIRERQANRGDSPPGASMRDSGYPDTISL
jgi:hypothetical protein